MKNRMRAEDVTQLLEGLSAMHMLQFLAQPDVHSDTHL